MRTIACAVLLLCLYFLLAFYVGRTMPDADLWGHLKFGMDFLDAGGILKQDPYSYMTAGTPWIDHEWLSEVIFALAYRAGGVLGISFLRIGLIAALATIFLVLLVRYKVPLAASILVGFALLAQLAPGVITLRPQLFTYLFFAIELVLLQAVERNGRQYLLWSIPFLTMLWINLHGGVLAGLALLFLWTILRLINCLCEKKSLDWQNNWIWCLTCLLSTLSTAATPYGFATLPFLLKTATVARPEIVEWAPVQFPSVAGVQLLLTWFYAFLVACLEMVRKEKIATAVMCICALLPLCAVRHVPLALLAISILSLPALSNLLRNRLQIFVRVDSAIDRPAVYLVIIPILMITSIISLQNALPRMSSIPINGIVPVQAVRLLKLSGARGNLACFFDWGEYCIWHLYPTMKVSIDGRRETTYSPDAYQKNVDLINGNPRSWNRLLASEHTDCVLVHKRSAAYVILSRDPYSESVFEDELCALFTPRGSPLAGRIMAAASLLPPDSGLQYFP